MPRASYWIFLISPWLAMATGAAVNEDEVHLPGATFFKGLPESEQTDYLSFELGRGYSKRSSTSNDPLQSINDDALVFPDALDIPEELVKKFEALVVPDNFTDNLFEFVETKFKLDIPKVRTLILRRFYCFEDGMCIDLEDVGAHCCPF